MRWLWGYSLVLGAMLANFRGPILPLLASLGLLFLGMLFVLGVRQTLFLGGLFIWLGIHDWYGLELLWRVFLIPGLLVFLVVFRFLMPESHWRTARDDRLDWEMLRNYWRTSDAREPTDSEERDWSSVPPPKSPFDPPPRGSGNRNSASESTAQDSASRSRKSPPPVKPLSPEVRAAYALLGVSPNADWETVKQAYRRQIARHHPDRFVGNQASAEAIQEANEHTQRILRAYELLQNFARPISQSPHTEI